MKVCQIYNIASHYRTAIYSLIDQAYDCDLYCSKNKTDIKTMDFSVLKGKVHEVRTINIGRASYQIGIPWLAFKRYDAYLVTGDTWSVSTWVFLLISRILGKRVYLWTHGILGRESRVRKALNILFIRLAKGAFLYGNRAKDLLIQAGVSPSRLFVIHNSLDYERQLTLRKEGLDSDVYNNHFKNTEKTIIFIGRLTRVKRLDLLVSALEQLANKGFCYNLVFVGGGPEQTQLELLVEEKGIKHRVWFFGPSYDEKQNAELIYNADLCVAPGNVGLTAMHTMVFGTPVISSNDLNSQMPEHEAIIEGQTCAFFENGNKESLADAINSWFESHPDRERVRKDCFKEIDNNWTPSFQINVINSVLNDANTTSN